MPDVLGDVSVIIGGDEAPLDAALMRSQSKVGKFAKETTDVNFRKLSYGFRSLAAAAGMKESPLMQAAQGVTGVMQGMFPKVAYLGALFAGWSAGTFLDQTFKISENLSKMILQSSAFGKAIQWWAGTTNIPSGDELKKYTDAGKKASTERETVRKKEAYEKIREGIRPNEKVPTDKLERENWAAEKIKQFLDIKKSLYWSGEERKYEKKTLGGSTAADINKAIQAAQTDEDKISRRKQLEVEQEQLKTQKQIKETLQKATPEFAGFV